MTNEEATKILTKIDIHTFHAAMEEWKHYRVSRDHKFHDLRLKYLAAHDELMKYIKDSAE